MDGASLRLLCATPAMKGRPTSARSVPLLNRARWSPLAVSRQLLTLIVETFVPAGGTLELVIDETLERRCPRDAQRDCIADPKKLAGA
jgi:hypothetical protein